jgi:hypothetical protein
VSYVRVSILGQFQTSEVWSINPVFDPTGEFPGTVDQTLLDDATTAIANLGIPTSLRGLLSTSASRIGARVEVRQDSDDSLLAISQAISTTAMPGTGTLALPPQNAIVASIRTNTPGASGRGRLYWPALAIALNGTGLVNAPPPATIALDMKTYLNGMASALATQFAPITFNLAVRSKTTRTTPHAVRIQVGNVVDTQRRRRDNIPESYASVTLP